jgi:hypothetical protein
MSDNYHPVFEQDCRKDTLLATIAATGTLSTAVDISPYRRGMFFLDAEFGTDTITIHVSNKTGGTFSTLYDDGAATGYTFTAVANTWNLIPAGAFAAGAIKIHTGTAVAAAATITFCLKS